jgi:hypothetical protein
MEKSEQRFIVKFLFFTNSGSKAIHTELTAIVGSMAYSLTQIKEWHVRFKTGDLSCENQTRPDHSPHILEKALLDFLEEFPFPTAEVIAQHFGQSKYIITEILQQELVLRRFSRRWVPHLLSEAQKPDRTAMTNDPLSVLHRQAD